MINEFRNQNKPPQNDYASRVAAAKEEALLKAAKANQRNPKPGPNEY